MTRLHGQALRALICALTLLPAAGCATLRHGHKGQPKCHEPAISGDVRNMPALRVPPGRDAPDTRNAVKVPPLPESARARLPDEPCLSEPPSFGGPPLGMASASAASRIADRVSWQVNGGAALTMGNTSDYLSRGWTIGGGLTYRPKPTSRWALQFDLGYADFNATSQLVNLAQENLSYRIDGGGGNVWSLAAAGKYTVPFTSTMNGYALLGIGGYHESIHVTETALYGGYVCDPWGYCYPVSTTGDVVVASKSLTKFGWNLGLGLEFAVGSNSAWFIEARYHHVQGDKAILYLPIQVGYRF